MICNYKTDITIIGGGVLGLETARQLSQQGYGVIVIEQRDSLAYGPSVRNQRFLHAGTYHGAQATDEAVEVAAQTHAGYEEIIKFIPEAVDNTPTYALFFDEQDVHRALEQWKQAEVKVEPVSPDAFKSGHTEMQLPHLRAAFLSEDRSIDVRRYLEKLVNTCKKQGVQFMVGAEFYPYRANVIKVEKADTTYFIEAQAFLVTAGYGLAAIYKKVTKQDLPVTFYKSHLFSFKKLVTRDNILPVGTNTVMSATIFDSFGRPGNLIGVNHSDYEVSTPDFTPDKKQIAQSFAHIKRVFQKVSTRYIAYACIKPNIQIGKTAKHYSLSSRVFTNDVASNFIFAVPGKMTEAPIAAKAVVNHLHHKVNKEIRTMPEPICADEHVKVTHYPYAEY